MSDFRDLKIWQKAHSLTLKIYKLSKLLPSEEKYIIIDQTKRASISVELNISEGYGRFHYSDEVNFLLNARDSACEVQNCLLLIKDLHFKKESISLFDEYTELIKMINGFIRHKRDKKSNS